VFSDNLLLSAEKEGAAEEGADGAAGEKEDVGFWDRVIKPEHRNSQVATVLSCSLRRSLEAHSVLICVCSGGGSHGYQEAPRSQALLGAIWKRYY
jgi:hypothetical protein